MWPLQGEKVKALENSKNKNIQGVVSKLFNYLPGYISVKDIQSQAFEFCYVRDNGGWKLKITVFQTTDAHNS